MHEQLTATRAKRRRVVLAMLPGAVLISMCAIGGAFGLRINLTASMPIGLWAQTDASNAKFVSFCLPEGRFAQMVRERGYVPHGVCPSGLAPLLKPIAARASDLVTVASNGIWINRHQVLTKPIADRDAQGRPLVPVAPGVYRTGPDSVWVLATSNPRSLDSRYIGAVPVTSILAHMKPLLVVGSEDDDMSVRW